VLTLLGCCTGITSLSLDCMVDAFGRDASSLWRALNNLHLKSLMLPVNIDLPNSISTLTVFQNLTHLDVCTHRVLIRPHAGLEALNSLTHLCLGLSLHSCNPAALKGLIGNSSLRLLGLRVPSSHGAVQRFLEQHCIVDRRIVLLPMNQSIWDYLGEHEPSVWELAEAKVRLPTTKKRETMLQAQFQLILNWSYRRASLCLSGSN
jgi:hypothetical protein